MEKLLLKPFEAAEALGICRSKLYQLLRNGTVVSVRIGGVPADPGREPGGAGRQASYRPRERLVVNGRAR